MSATSHSCLVCQQEAVDLLLDLGDQPLSNRFPRTPQEDTERHRMQFGCCRHCGLAQLISPPPPSLIRPRVDWIRYNEPEAHLDDLVDRLIKLSGVERTSRIVGLTYKEDSTLERLQRRGYTNTYRFDANNDWNVSDPAAGLETLQEQLTRDWSARQEPADVVIARHLLEHSQNPTEVAAALGGLLKPGGYLVLEVPDNQRLFKNREICFLWEEHVSYFTATTLESSLLRLGFQPCWIENYPYPVENALVCVAQVANEQKTGSGAASDRYSEATTFVSNFDEDRRALRSRLAEFSSQTGKIAVFGAGHLASKFINFYGVQDSIEFVADDHPNKQNTLLPGSRLPIRPGAKLRDAEIRLALLSVNPESEPKVISKYGELAGDALEFASLFRSSPRSFWN